MATSPLQIALMADDQLEATAATMARAFQTDPLFMTVWPDPEERAVSLRKFARWDLGNAGPIDKVFVTAGSIVGAAKAIRSDISRPLDNDDFHRLEVELSSHAWQRFSRDVQAYGFADEQLSAKTPEAHWYLQALGVAPEHQGRGIGTALLDAIHACADADGLPTTLLTFQPRNVPLYQRHGYRIVAEGTEPSQELYYWCMKRPPDGS